MRPRHTCGPVDLLDVVLALLFVGAVASGWRRGLTWVALSFLGLAAGVVLGAAVAPPVARHFAGHDASQQALIGTGVFLFAVAVIQGIGTGIGYQARIATLRTRIAEIDSFGGAALAVVGAAAGAWYVGLTFAQSPFPSLDRQIQGSAVLRTLDRIAPRPPAFLAEIQNLLRGSGSAFTNPFAGLAPESQDPVPIPTSIDTAGVRRAAASTWKVLSEGCGLEAGSSWPIGDDDLVTNAHVVAGGQVVHVQAPDGSRTLVATVVLFDPEVDLAVLHVPGLGVASLPLAGADPARGDTGAVVGYPNGGPEQSVPAGVRGLEEAQGRDIYNDALVTRRIEVLEATVIPGNSGGPIVRLDGTVIGVVFAASTTDSSEGYALAMSTVGADINAGRGRTAPVSTQNCTQ